MKTIKLNCTTCGQSFDKSKAEYNRRVKAGKTEFYCSLSCSGKNKVNIENLKNRTNRYDITQHSNNHKDQYSPFRYYINRILNGSGKKHGPSDLTVEYLKDLWDKQQGKCISGIDMHLPKNTRERHDVLHCASLDRIDSSKGYIQGNVQFICKFINLGKGDSSDSEVKQFLFKLTG